MKAKLLRLIAAFVLSAGELFLRQLPSSASTYSLAFDSTNTIIYSDTVKPFILIQNVASFSPITLFDGDTLNIQFQNVPIPVGFEQYNASFITILSGNTDGARIQESVLSPSVFGTRLMTQDSCTITGCFPPVIQHDTYFYGAPSPLFVGSSVASLWSLSLLMISGEPPSSAGLTVDHILVQETWTPVPPSLPLFATGLGVLGLLGWRKKKTIG